MCAQNSEANETRQLQKGADSFVQMYVFGLQNRLGRLATENIQLPQEMENMRPFRVISKPYLSV